MPAGTFFTAISPAGMFRVVSSFMESVDRHQVNDGSAPGSEEIDLSLLEDSLRLSPWQRLLENERALALVRMLEASRLPVDGPVQPNP